MSQDFQVQVAEMYRKYEVLIERVSKYDNLILDVAALHVQMDAMQSSFADLLKIINDQFKDRDSKHESVLLAVKVIHDKIDANQCQVNAELNQHKQVMAEVKSDHKSLHHFSERTYNRLAEHSANAASKDDVEIARRYLSDFSNSLSLQIKHVTSVVDRTKAELDSYSSSQKYLEDRVGNLDNDIKMAAVVGLKQKDDLEEKIKGIANAIPLQLANFSKGIVSRVDEMQACINAIPSTQEIRLELVPRIEMLSMDCRNASLKLENHDQQIKFFDKKLESTNLRVGKLELKQ